MELSLDNIMEELYFTLKCNEDDINVKVYKPNEIKRVVLGIHGLTGGKESSFLNHLAYNMNDTLLISFDLPMHGDSKVNKFKLSDALDYIKIIVKYIDNNYKNIDKCVVGTSFGGYLTLLSLKMFKNYKILLRAPAINICDILLNQFLEMTQIEFKKMKCINISGIDITYELYESLLNSKIVDNIPKMMIIQGDKDELVNPLDIEAFCNKHNNVLYTVIHNADHRFSNELVFNKVVKLTKEYFEK